MDPLGIAIVDGDHDLVRFLDGHREDLRPHVAHGGEIAGRGDPFGFRIQQEDVVVLVAARVALVEHVLRIARPARGDHGPRLGAEWPGLVEGLGALLDPHVPHAFVRLEEGHGLAIGREERLRDLRIAHELRPVHDRRQLRPRHGGRQQNGCAAKECALHVLFPEGDVSRSLFGVGQGKTGTVDGV